MRRLHKASNLFLTSPASTAQLLPYSPGGPQEHIHELHGVILGLHWDYTGIMENKMKTATMDYMGTWIWKQQEDYQQ